MGETAFLLRDLDVAPYRLAQALREADLPGVLDVVSAYQDVGIYVDPFRFDPDCLRELPEVSTVPARQHFIPVCYEHNEDLLEVASICGVQVEDVIGYHASASYDCVAVGFQPGFAYLTGVPEPISRVPRLANPRKFVAKGSVGITGSQTGVYPSDSPGGWRLIGMCPLELVCIEEDYFPIEAGDEVQFERIDQTQFDRLRGERL